MARLYGDVSVAGNKNAVDSTDAMLISKFLSKQIAFSADQLAAADVNGDGKVTIQDSMAISQFLAKLLPTDTTAYKRLSGKLKVGEDAGFSWSWVLIGAAAILVLNLLRRKR